MGSLAIVQPRELSRSRTRNLNRDSVLAQDVLEIITVFAARLYGSRSKKNKKLVEAAKVLMNDE